MFIICLEHIFLDETLYLKDKDMGLFTFDKNFAQRLSESEAREYIKKHRKIEMYYDMSTVYIEKIS